MVGEARMADQEATNAQKTVLDKQRKKRGTHLAARRSRRLCK